MYVITITSSPFLVIHSLFVPNNPPGPHHYHHTHYVT